ncbi:MAG TPA: bifunctional 5,10-methylenetetrahydrofolate dehydrogenase/5,10-methenyltetrahydrofolate cyclohydrolase [Candidatus Saccharimonadales bacterium]|jgi:methylenetetrahydrofolate dehydrogenase (NADP+)/methenyltetrahydrofolate cyclohydrolase|nr:bifunctional 5,10-methylenetetrahydrofolate dehydrogenase/5,10-methenyltetrahydrofolate cyclohydrolase [Candidatus Saccharimonadales bacterium]
MARLLHGRPLAEKIKAETRGRAEKLRVRNIEPTLAIVGLGGDPAAHSYVERLGRSATDCGIRTIGGFMPRDTTEQQLIAHLEQLSMDRSVNGILLLTPLPGALDEAHVIDHIAIAKDVEGMHPFNMGFLADGRPRFVPSTADAVVELLKFYEVPLQGAHAVIIGRSTVIGRPAAYLLLAEDATVTIAHKRTRGLASLTQLADILVVGVGRPAFITGAMVKPGATVIDAGINMTPNGLAGDVELASVASVAGALSPVPGGLGAVTAALLLRNVLTATEHQTS